jgi:hypothetical protein
VFHGRTLMYMMIQFNSVLYFNVLTQQLQEPITESAHITVTIGAKIHSPSVRRIIAANDIQIFGHFGRNIVFFEDTISIRESD